MSSAALTAPRLARTLHPVELNEFLEQTIEQPAPMLGPILRPGTLGMIYGPAGVGKSYLALGLALSITHGLPFLGWSVPKPQSVLYVDGELPAWLLQRRLQELRAPMEPLMGDRSAPLRIVTPDLEADGIPMIDSDEGQRALLLAVLDTGGMGPVVDLVIFDNLSCLSAPEDDNSAGSWSAIQNLMLALRRKSIACIVVHHAGKGGQQRGTSRRADVLDVVLKLTPDATGIDNERTRVFVEFEKARGLTPDEKEPFTAELGSADQGGLVWTRSAAQMPTGQRVRQMLLDGMSPADVAAELGKARSFAYRIEKQMIDGGELAPRARPRGRTANGAQFPNWSPTAPLIGGRGQRGLHRS